MRAALLGISVWGPGLDGWDASLPILAGHICYHPRDPAPPPALLPPAERRRCGPVVRLALAAAAEAASQTTIPPETLRNVFASSTGDGPIVGAILDALATGTDSQVDNRVVSPTQFHNSVHNAPSGYWSIAVASRRPATCIGCHDDTFAAGLLTAMAEHTTSAEPVLFCCYDHTLPAPLDRVRPVGPPFATALVLGAVRDDHPAPQLELAYHATPAPTTVPISITNLPHPLAALAAINPAARALPLLAALATNTSTTLVLPYLGGHLILDLS